MALVAGASRGSRGSVAHVAERAGDNRRKDTPHRSWRFSHFSLFTLMHAGMINMYRHARTYLLRNSLSDLVRSILFGAVGRLSIVCYAKKLADMESEYLL